MANNLPGLSLGSGFWVKDCSDVDTDLGALPLSHQHPVPDCWAGIFLGTGSLRQQKSPLGMSSCKICVRRDRVITFQRWGRRGKKQQNACRAFVALPWFLRGGCSRAAGPAQLQVLLSCGIEFFSESEAAVPRQTNTVRKTGLDHVFASCDLVQSVNLLVLFTFGRCDWMPPGKCCRWFHTGYENPCLVKSSAFLFSKVSPSVLANSDEGFLEGFIPFCIPKDNTQRFPGLLFAQVLVSAAVRGERGRAVCVSHNLKCCAARNLECAGKK